MVIFGRAQVASRLLSLSRVFHMFGDTPGEPLDPNAPNDISDVVSLYANEELEMGIHLASHERCIRLVL